MRCTKQNAKNTNRNTLLPGIKGEQDALGDFGLELRHGVAEKTSVRSGEKEQEEEAERLLAWRGVEGKMTNQNSKTSKRRHSRFPK